MKEASPVRLPGERPGEPESAERPLNFQGRSLKQAKLEKSKLIEEDEEH